MRLTVEEIGPGLCPVESLVARLEDLADDARRWALVLGAAGDPRASECQDLAESAEASARRAREARA